MIQVIGVKEPTGFDLSKAIAAKKKEMLKLGMEHGLTDSRTLKCSQQLDLLINKHLNERQLSSTG